MFSKIIHILLNGEIIDSVRYSAEYDLLRNPNFLQEINQYLLIMDRACISTKCDSGYYCVYTTINGNNALETVRRDFNELMMKIEPLLNFMRICMSCSDNQKPIVVNEVIQFSQYLAVIENSSHLQHLLKNTVTLLNRSTAAQLTTQLESVFKYLEDNHYFILISANVYRATAKWDLLYEQLEFIAEQEDIDFDDVNEITETHQGNLL